MQRVQMVGTQRSGSNLLRLMLDQSPEVFAPPSAHLLDIFADLVETYGDLSVLSHRTAMLADALEVLRRNVLKWPVHLVPADVAREPVDSAIEMFFRIYDSAAASSSCRVWVCKSLENVKFMPQLHEADPDLLFVHIIRDGRDVALSFQSAPIGPKHPLVTARRWIEDQSMVDRFRADHDASVISIRYEDLVVDPSSTIRSLHRRIGVVDGGEPLDFHRTEAAALAPRLSQLWQNLDRPVMTDRVGRHAHPDHAALVESFEMLAGQVLASYGYLVAGEVDHRSVDDIDWAEIEASDRKQREVVASMADTDQERLHKPYELFCSALRQRTTADVGVATSSRL